MTIDELQRKLDAITGDDPISIARRLAIMEMIGKLMEAQEHGD